MDEPIEAESPTDAINKINDDVRARIEDDIKEQLGQQMRSLAKVTFRNIESKLKCIFNENDEPIAHTVDFDRNPTEVFAMQHMNGLISLFYVQKDGMLLPIGKTDVPIPWDFGKMIFIKDDDEDIIEGGVE